MISSFAAVLIAIALFVLPGAVVGWCAGMRLRWALAVGVAITAGVWSVLSWWYGERGIAVTGKSLLVGTMVFAVVGLLWRAVFSVGTFRRWLRRDKQHAKAPSESETTSGKCDDALNSSEQSLGTAVAVKENHEGENRRSKILRRLDPFWILPSLGVLAGLVIFLRRATLIYDQKPYGLGTIFQGWDVLWHASAIRYIMETGIASAPKMGPLQNVETHKDLFYPTGFHTMAYALQYFTGAEPTAALNATSYVLPGIGLTVSAALLAWMLVGKRCLTASLAAAVAPVVVVGVFPLFYSEYYMGAWPNISGIALAGLSAAAIMNTPRSPKSVLAAVLTFSGASALHPSAAPVVVMIVGVWWALWAIFVPFLGAEESVWGVKNRFLKGIAARIRDVSLLAAAGILGAAFMLPQWKSGSAQAGEVKQFSETQIPITRAESWQRVLEMQWRWDYFAPTQWWFVIAAVAGIVVILLWRRALWSVVLIFLFGACAAHSLKWFGGSFGKLLSHVTALHYNNAHRLMLPVALLATAFAAVALAALTRFILGGFYLFWRDWKDKKKDSASTPVRIFTATAATAVTVGLAAGHVIWFQKPFEPHYEWAIGKSLNGRMIGSQERAAFEWLRHQPGAYDGLIANNPGEGTGWMYPLHGLPSLHRHFLYPKVPHESATSRLFRIPDQIGKGLPPKPGSYAEMAQASGFSPEGYEGDRSEYATKADFAARDLNIKYYIISPPSFWKKQKDIPAQVRGTFLAPGLTLVYRNGATSIFAVNANLSDADIQQAYDSGKKASTWMLPPIKKHKVVKTDPTTGLPDTWGANAQGSNETEFKRPQIWNEKAAGLFEK